MRILILAAGAALTLSACGGGSTTENTEANMMVGDNMMATDVNPYGMQAHLHDKTQPENLDFLRRIRALLDEYVAISIGEVGADDALAAWPSTRPMATSCTWPTVSTC